MRLTLPEWMGMLQKIQKPNRTGGFERDMTADDYAELCAIFDKIDQQESQN